MFASVTQAPVVGGATALARGDFFHFCDTVGILCSQLGARSVSAAVGVVWLLRSIEATGQAEVLFSIDADRLATSR